MPEFDPGPAGSFATHWDNRPSYSSGKARFRMNWGPIYYRGRLDGSAKVIVIGQDPAADENVARRILGGSAGQRAQGVPPQAGPHEVLRHGEHVLVRPEGQVSASPAIKNWRNQLLDLLKTSQIEAVVAFGAGAHRPLTSGRGRAACL
jgi:hypothetical protein